MWIFYNVFMNDSICFKIQEIYVFTDPTDNERKNFDSFIDCTMDEDDGGFLIVSIVSFYSL